MKFIVKFNDICCESCNERIFIKDIFDKLQQQYEPNTGAKGYTSILVLKCKCGKRYKFVFDCHENNGVVTVVVNKKVLIEQVANKRG